MKSTHILIPIEDIMGLIQHYNTLLKENAEDKTENGTFNFARYGAKSAISTELLMTKGKQISFDEKDIITKAIEHSEELNEFNITEALYQARISSYKQP